ncbi:MAG: bifunctional class I SAM-dependent methyltransferase/glycosyltransferase family 2 protein [Verrucomicrobiales bacterium]|nr:bifunctional class I SAM-dependent methyltransferase/glycosyltransferase family 2 protein [Verrucomicrobiales bacterium]
MSRPGIVACRGLEQDEAFPPDDPKLAPRPGSDRRGFYEARAHFRPREAQRKYHRLLERYYKSLIPPGARVLEVGCGLGDLLAALQPSTGVGLDFSMEMVRLARDRHPNHTFFVGDAENFQIGAQFDFIILSDLVNDLQDVQNTLARLRRFAHPRTRLVLNFFNYLWLPILKAAESLQLKAPTPRQNWLSTSDMINLLNLAGWEVLKSDARILWPVRTPFLEPLCNRWLAPFLRHLCLTMFCVARLKPSVFLGNRDLPCSVVIPARNEAGNIESAVRRTPEMGLGTEIIFVEGGSSDATLEEIQRVTAAYPRRKVRTLRQQGFGKSNAVREAFGVATGDILFILDADLTVAPEELPKFYEAIRSGTGEFINGVRLVYPPEDQAMRFLNMIANKLFSLAFGWLLGQPIKDTLCGTKVLLRADYNQIEQSASEFGRIDPFGDFDLLFGAARLNLRIVDLPVRYRARQYGKSNIRRWKHGVRLVKVFAAGATRLKFI